MGEDKRDASGDLELEGLVTTAIVNKKTKKTYKSPRHMQWAF